MAVTGCVRYLPLDLRVNHVKQMKWQDNVTVEMCDKRLMCELNSPVTESITVSVLCQSLKLMHCLL